MDAKDILKEIFDGQGYQDNGIYVQKGLTENDLINKKKSIPEWAKETMNSKEEAYLQTVQESTEYFKDQLERELIDDSEAVSKLQSRMKKYAEDNLI